MKNEKAVYFFTMIFFLLLIVLLLIQGIASQANNPLYMVIYRGARGLNFYCLDYMPIAPYRDLIWDTELGATELYEDAGALSFQIVQVESCNLVNVYELDDSRAYALGFSSHNTDGHPTHRHITGLASWVELLEIAP